MEKIVEELCTLHGTLIEVKKNTTLLDKEIDGQQSYVYYLLDGICALTGYSVKGQEVVLLYQTAGNMIGINPYVSGTNSGFYSYHGPKVMARTHCRLYQIPSSVFQHYLETSLEFNHYIVHLLSHNYHRTLAHFKQIQEEESVTVVCRFLLSMCIQTADGLVLPRFFTHDELSKYLGVHLVTVSRILSQLLKNGYVQRISDGLLLTDVSALQHIVDHCETFQY
ncbi:MAG: Crp/Fnr family transcriptional regulator [Lachnospiraceae bacterium]|nr:Crp/Fnr family transcriptional regulator [Lachnospiraceae bacterium]